MVLGERKGFGSRLILRVLPGQLRGTTEIVYRPEGVVFVLNSTLDAIGDRSAVEGV